MAQGVNEPLYTRDILRLAASIPNIVPFADLPDGVEVRSPTCGSRLAMTVEVDDAGRVKNLRQAVEACAFGQAAAALVGQGAAGLTHDEAAAALANVEAWQAGEGEAEDAWPGLSVLDPARDRKGRHGAMLLPWRALVRAIEDAAQ